MESASTTQEANDEFRRYLQVRVFGLVAFVDHPNENEHFPIASGVLVETEVGFALLTVAHFLRDVERWKNQNRLSALLLMVHHESGLCNPIPLDLDKSIGSFSDDFDSGFVLLEADLLTQIAKFGGQLTKRDELNCSLAEMNKFFLVGHAAAYCRLVRETIATQQRGSEYLEWTISRPGDLKVAFSRLELEGPGSDRGTYRFALVKGFDDYSGTSGGPIIGYAPGSLIRDYSLVAIQSKQVFGATAEQKPTHLIATSAALAIHLMDERIRQMMASKE